MTTLGYRLQNAKQRLMTVSPSASLDAQLLLGEVLQVNRAYVLAHPERELTPEEITAYETLIARRERGEPVAYILGRRAFYDREFKVTPAVLIPRPETEHLLELALEVGRTKPDLTAVDVGTGSGALAVTFAAHNPQARVLAVDISPDALKVAQENAQGVEITFLQGDLLQPLIEHNIGVDLVMANLPYIASDEVPQLEVSRYEPVLALDGGQDGLELVRRLLNQARLVCRPGAVLLLEIGADQGAAALDLAKDAAEAEIVKDYAGHDRILKLRL
jgi:release factor glutamine methyltransferase